MLPELVDHRQLERLMRCAKDSMRPEAFFLCACWHALLLWQGTRRMSLTRRHSAGA